MTDIAVGVLSLGLGALLLFAGYVAMRGVLAFTGAFVGFMLGGGIVAGVTGTGFLAGVATWIGAVLGALLLGWLAYAFYQVAVLVGLAFIGFAIGAGLVRLFGGEQPWLLWLVGGVVAALLVAVGMLGDLPAAILIILTSIAGAETVVASVLLLIGAIDVETLQGGADVALEHGWWWAAAVFALAIVGIVVQGRRQRRAANMRAAWAQQGAAGRPQSAA